jgi:hypothetical protein
MDPVPMSTVYENLVENSLHAALGSIEIYNKPDFKYREQVFTILNINAWELLLKAKILKDASDNLSSLYIPLPDGSFKTNRSGNPMTIEIIGAINKLSLAPTIATNLEKMIEIRDTVIHFYRDEALSYIIYVLGVASLKNYQKLINEWFSRSLLDYNFYILPLGFAYNFKTLSLLEVEQKSDIIANLIASVSDAQSSISESDGYYFVCEITTQLVSAKKLKADPDFVTAIDPTSSPETLIVERLQRLIDKYPLSFAELWQKVRSAKPNAKKNAVHKLIKDHSLKDNPQFSSYHFRKKVEFEQYEKEGILPQPILSIYNEDAVRYVIENLEG